MRKHLAATTALTAALLAAPASATPCPFVVDDPADNSWTSYRPSSGPPHVVLAETDQTEILSADIATGATTLVTVVRVKNLDPDLVGTAGVGWNIGWHLDGVRHELYARRHNGGVYTGYNVGATAVPVSVVFDHAADTVTWTAARTDVPGLATGATFDRVGVITYVFSISADSAGSEPGDTYVDGDPGCIPAA